MTPAARELRRAIVKGVAGFGGTVTVEALASRAWASITFTGARSRLTLRLEGRGAGAAADAYCHGLEEREFDLSGHIVVDIAVKERSDESDARVRLTLEALTVEMD
jgi:hypothetical protein